MAPQLVEVEISGGIGNQLFQYAAGLALSRRLNAQLVLDTSWYRRGNRRKSGREFILPQFINIDKDKLRSSALHPVVQKLSRVFSRYIKLDDDWAKPTDLDSLVTTRNIRMRGYWQNERYFSLLAPILRSELTSRRVVSPLALSLEKEIQSQISIGLHVRRGDYISNPETNAFHGVCDISYYVGATELVFGATGASKVFVFSDEINWCKRELRFDTEITYVEDTIGDVDQLKLMSLCDHHVISNSSFSWWAAWLGQSEEQIVVYPKSWFADGSSLEAMPNGWMPL